MKPFLVRLAIDLVLTKTTMKLLLVRLAIDLVLTKTKANEVTKSSFNWFYLKNVYHNYK